VHLQAQVDYFCLGGVGRRLRRRRRSSALQNVDEEHLAAQVGYLILECRDTLAVIRLHGFQKLLVLNCSAGPNGTWVRRGRSCGPEPRSEDAEGGGRGGCGGDSRVEGPEEEEEEDVVVVKEAVEVVAEEEEVVADEKQQQEEGGSLTLDVGASSARLRGTTRWPGLLGVGRELQKATGWFVAANGAARGSACSPTPADVLPSPSLDVICRGKVSLAYVNS
jgi:hypothetical protein